MSTDAENRAPDRYRDVPFVQGCVSRQQPHQPSEGNKVFSRRNVILSAVAALLVTGAGVVIAGRSVEKGTKRPVPTLEELDRQFEGEEGASRYVYVCDQWAGTTEKCHDSLQVFGPSSDPDEPDAGDLSGVEIRSPVD